MKKMYINLLCILINILALFGVLHADSAYEENLVVQPSPIIQLQFPYNINTDYVSTTVVNTGTVTQSNNFAVLQTGTNATGSATMQSLGRLHYHPGQGCSCLFTAVFTTGVANNNQIIGIGNTQDGFFFGYNGTSFGVMRRSGGTDTWVPQAAWNGDPFNGTGPSGVTLVPTNGNVFKIQYQWLGFGAIKFYIENPVTGGFILVHTIEYSNTNTTPSLRNPSMQLMAAATNAGNTTNITLRTSSMVGMVEGKLNPYNDVRNSILTNAALNTLGAENNILTIQNKATYQGVNNQVVIYPDFLTLMNITANNNSVIIRLYLNPTVGGTPAFTDINTNNSVVSFDTAGTTVTGGNKIATFFCCGSTTRSFWIDLSDMELRLFPGDRLVVTAQGPFLASSTVHIALSWRERF